MPWVRFTVRRLMIAVAVAGVALGAWGIVARRRARFERLFSHHFGLAGPSVNRSFDPGHRVFVTAKGRWHHDLAMKYAEAARRPWLPVVPDPPEPD